MDQRPYLNIEAAAGVLECTTEEVIYIGAKGFIPIYVLPKGWKADYVTYIDEEAAENIPEAEPVNPEKLWSKELNYSQTELLTPVRLHQYTLAVLLADPNTKTKYFFAPSYADRNAFDELRVHSDVDGNLLENVAINDCTLVLMRNDINIYLNSRFHINEPSMTNSALSDKTNTAEPDDIITKPLGVTQHNTLLKQIAILAIVIADKASKYKKGNGKINIFAISKDVEAFLVELENDINEQALNTHGLGKSNLHKNISAGIKLLTKI